MQPDSEKLLTNLRGRAIPIEGLDVPGPLVFHVGRSNGLDPSLDVGQAELMSASPHGIQVIAHMTEFMFPHLKRANPVNHEGAEHVIAIKLALDESPQDVVDDLELVRLGRHILEVQLGDWQREVELGQV